MIIMPFIIITLPISKDN